MNELSPREIVTEPCRISFPALFDPKPVSKNKPNDLKYQSAVLIPKSMPLAPFAACIRAAMEETFGQVIKLSGNKSPIKPCAEKEQELAGYEDGWHYINAKSGYAPNVVDQKLQPIIDPARIYAGCWCRFHLQAFAWDHPEGGKGVSFSLNAVQLVRDGDRLDGKSSSSNVFEPVEVVEDSTPGGEMSDLFD